MSSGASRSRRSRRTPAGRAGTAHRPVRVAVLAGGRSGEHDVSLASAAAVRAGLERGGHDPVAVEISREGRWTLRTASRWCWSRPRACSAATRRSRRCTAPTARTARSRALLEVLDVPLRGRGGARLRRLHGQGALQGPDAAAGLPQVDYLAARRGDDPGKLAALGLPVFVKPAQLGSSVGISKVLRPRRPAGRAGGGVGARPAGDRRGDGRRAWRSSARCWAISTRWRRCRARS